MTLAKDGGPPLDTSKSDGRFSVVMGVRLDSPESVNGTFRASPGTPEGYDAKTNNPFVGGGYIAALGRDGQLPPFVAEMEADAKKRGMFAVVHPMFDKHDQYIGYRLDILAHDQQTVIRSLDVTGAASRFVPWHLVPRRTRDMLKTRVDRASDLDAPPESGNFDGGFVASATQAERYGKHRRAQGATP